ncbi:hypothetical protein D3C75_1245650 [compost metagenome]
MVPATATDVNAGRKKEDLKNSLPTINLLLIITANNMGKGINSTKVPNMYTTLFLIDIKNTLSVSNFE